MREPPLPGWLLKNGTNKISAPEESASQQTETEPIVAPLPAPKAVSGEFQNAPLLRKTPW